MRHACSTLSTRDAVTRGTRAALGKVCDDDEARIVAERPEMISSLGPRARSESPRRARSWDARISKIVSKRVLLMTLEICTLGPGLAVGTRIFPKSLAKRVLLTTLEIYDINEFGDIVYFQTR